MEKNKTDRSSHPKYRANIFSKLFRCWVVPLVWYARTHRIGTKDLHEVLPENRSKPLTDKLERFWEEELIDARKKKKQPKLWKALWRLFGCDFSKYAIHTFIMNVVISLWQPILMSKVIAYFDPKSTITTSEAYGYAVTITVLLAIDSILFGYEHFGLTNICVRMRIACSSLIYRKLLKLPHYSAKQPSTGEVINLLSNDVVRLEYSLMDLHCFWALPMLTLAVCYMGWKTSGASSLVGIGLLALQAIPLHGITAYLHKYLREKIAMRSDKRLLLLNESIRGMRILKMFTWEKPFEHLIKLARRKEINLIAVQTYIKQLPLMIGTFIHQLSILIIAMILKAQGAIINPAQIYTMVLYLNTMRGQYVYWLGHALRSTAETIAALNRIEEFLLLEELIPISTQPNVDQADGVVLIKNASARINSRQNVDILDDINLQILPGKLYMLLGPIDSGKSSLLKLILGELKATTGNVFIQGDISYASQEPWLFNASIKNNILFGNPYDDEKYNKVITACALLKDFAQLPDGDKTVVGEHGSVISGGQRVRINFARAVYRDADIYLLDDPLCAADIAVGQHLFENCINGLLKDKTRILVTHHLQYLEVANGIILMKNGHIEYQGSFDDFQKQDKFLKYLNANDATDDLVIESSPHSSLSSNLNILTEFNEKAEEELEESQQLMPKKGTKNIKDQNSKEVIHRRSIGTKNSQKSIYTSYIKAGGIRLLILTATVMSIMYTLGNVFDYTFSEWIKHQSEEYNITLNSTLASPIETKFSFFNSLDVLGGIMLIIMILSVLRAILFTKFSINASKVIHDKMLSCLFNAPITFFNNNNSGEILNRFSKDMGTVDYYTPPYTSESLSIIIFTPLLLLQIMINNQWLIILIAIMICICSAITHIFFNILRESRRLEAHVKSSVYSHASTSLCGVLTIRSCKGESAAHKEFDVQQDHHTAAYSTYLDSLFAFILWIEMLQAMFLSAVPFIFFLLKDSNVSGATVGLVISEVQLLTVKIMHCARMFTELSAQMVSTERILDYTKIKPEEKNKKSTDERLPSQWPVKGEIKFDHMYLNYSESSASILKNLDFTIHSQSKVGIVGRTGAGKSSLIAALFRLIEIKGSIFIDGVDTTKIDLQQLRKKISIFPQEPILFSVPLRQNLDPLQEHDDSTIWAALNDVKLNKDFLSLDEIINQSCLSNGKRQLLCLARTILNKNKILVLDEVTANVDEQTDALIQEVIRDKFRDCTVLMIAHRLQTVIDCDKILVIDKGEVVEYDHPHVLLQNKNSFFFKMVQQTDNATENRLRKTAEKAYNYVNPVSED